MAITPSDAPTAMDPQLRAPDVAGRVARPDSGVVDVLLPIVTTAAMSNPAVRRAFAVATDRQAYATADGAPMTPSASVLARVIPGRPVADPLGISPTGDPAAALAVLAGGGVTTPVRLRLGYAPSEAATRALTALLPGWVKAGFAVTLVPRTTGPEAVDVELTQRSAAYPSGGAVIPELVDRIGDPTLSAAAAAAEGTSDASSRNRAWGDLDATLTAAGDVVPLAERHACCCVGPGSRRTASTPFSAVSRTLPASPSSVESSFPAAIPVPSVTGEAGLHRNVSGEAWFGHDPATYCAPVSVRGRAGLWFRRSGGGRGTASEGDQPPISEDDGCRLPRVRATVGCRPAISAAGSTTGGSTSTVGAAI